MTSEPGPKLRVSSTVATRAGTTNIASSIPGLRRYSVMASRHSVLKMLTVAYRSMSGAECYAADMILASNFSVTWNGIDGWLFLLGAIAFILAAFASVRPSRFASNVLLFISLGLLLWILTNLVSGG
jgi:hypothetical protein